MVDRVLVPLDGSPLSEKALEYAILTFPAKEIVALTVIDPIDVVYRSEGSGPLGGERWFKYARSRAADIGAVAEKRGEQTGVSVTTDTAVGRPRRQILKYADEHDVDQIVMGTHGRSGLSRVALGSVAEAVVRRSPVPVTTIR